MFPTSENKLAIIFGNQLIGYSLRFYQLTRETNQQIGLQEDQDLGVFLDLKSKVAGTVFQEKLLDGVANKKSNQLFLLFERGIKIYSLSAKR